MLGFEEEIIEACPADNREPLTSGRILNINTLCGYQPSSIHPSLLLTAASPLQKTIPPTKEPQQKTHANPPHHQSNLPSHVHHPDTRFEK